MGEFGRRCGIVQGLVNDDEDDNYNVDADDCVLINPVTSPSSLIKATTDQSQQSITTSTIFHVQDRYRLVYLAFVWFGLAGTLPWNFFITAEDYWQYKLRTVNSSGALDPTRRNTMQTYFGSYFNLASMFPGLVGFIFCSIYSYRISLHWRVIAALMVALLQFVVTATLSLIDTDSWQITFFAVTMTSVVVMNVFNAVFQASSFGMAGVLPSKYMRAAMNGQAVGGVLASVIRILTTATADNQHSGAYYFFSSAIIIIVICIVAYVTLCRNRYYNFHCCRVVALKTTTMNDDLSGGIHAAVQLKPSFRQVFDRVKVYAVSVTLVFVGSLASYPTISILVVSVNRNSGSEWTGKLFLPFTCFLLYNCWDLCGRVISSWIRVIPVNSLILPGLCVARLALVPLLLACNVQPRKHFDVAFDNDVIFVLIISLIGVSNGYLATLCMSTAPTLVRKEDQELAGVLMSFFMSVGICSGAIVAFIAIQFL